MKDIEFIYVPREHDFIPLSNEDIVQLKERVYMKYINYIDNNSKQILPELVGYIFDSKWRQFIENRSDELVEDNEWYVESYIYNECVSLVCYLKEKDVKSQLNFFNAWKAKRAE